MIGKNSFQLFRFKTLSNSIGIFIMIYFILIISNLNAQTYDPFIQNKVDELSYDSVYSKLQAFENLGIKQAGTEALDQTASWIIIRLLSLTPVVTFRFVMLILSLRARISWAAWGLGRELRVPR